MYVVKKNENTPKKQPTEDEEFDEVLLNENPKSQVEKYNQGSLIDF